MLPNGSASANWNRECENSDISHHVEWLPLPSLDNGKDEFELSAENTTPPIPYLPTMSNFCGHNLQQVPALEVFINELNQRSEALGRDIRDERNVKKRGTYRKAVPRQDLIDKIKSSGMLEQSPFVTGADGKKWNSVTVQTSKVVRALQVATSLNEELSIKELVILSGSDNKRIYYIIHVLEYFNLIVRTRKNMLTIKYHGTTDISQLFRRLNELIEERDSLKSQLEHVMSENNMLT